MHKREIGSFSDLPNKAATAEPNYKREKGIFFTLPDEIAIGTDQRPGLNDSDRMELEQIKQNPIVAAAIKRAQLFDELNRFKEEALKKKLSRISEKYKVSGYEAEKILDQKRYRTVNRQQISDFLDGLQSDEIKSIAETFYIPESAAAKIFDSKSMDLLKGAINIQKINALKIVLDSGIVKNPIIKELLHSEIGQIIDKSRHSRTDKTFTNADMERDKQMEIQEFLFDLWQKKARHEKQ